MHAHTVQMHAHTVNVCVCEREREREREKVCVCVCSTSSSLTSRKPAKAVRMLEVSIKDSAPPCVERQSHTNTPMKRKYAKVSIARGFRVNKPV